MKVLNALSAAAVAAVLMAPATAAHAAPSARDVVTTYADMAKAMYEDSLIKALAMRDAIDVLLATPTEETLQAARQAWLAARVPYSQTEGYRFGNAIVDDWETRVNAWPLDEGLIDYVDAAYAEGFAENPIYNLNVIANPTVEMGQLVLEADVITPDFLADYLHQSQEVDANVATGYHAIEFLLWGQDLNGTGPGAGERPATDYDLAQCTNGNCDRRGQYLTATSELLIWDLEEIIDEWSEGGLARESLLALDDASALGVIVTGLGSLSYGELAGERIQLGLLLGDPEEEHDCFSDNTHNSHYYNQVGMMAIYTGRYTRIDGTVFSGPGLSDLAKAEAPDTALQLSGLFRETYDRLRRMKQKADAGEMYYDQMLAIGNEEGHRLLSDIVEALTAQTRGIERVVADLGLNIAVQGSNSLDNPLSVR